MSAFAPDTGTRSLAGSLALRAVADSGGITRVVEIERRSPMQVQRPLYLDAAHAGLANVHVINATAGLFAGDDLKLRIDVGSGARIAVTTPAMTRVYAMPDGGAATSRVDLHIRGGGYLEYLPAASILCEGAALRHEMRVDVEVDAHAVVGEVWAFGRVAHGELHAYRELCARTELWRGESLVLADALALKPVDASPEAAVGSYAAYGTLTLSGARVDAALLMGVRRLLDERGGQILAGASTLVRDGGIGVRVLGVSANSVQVTLENLMSEFRSYVLNTDRSAIGVGAANHPCGGMQ